MNRTRRVLTSLFSLLLMSQVMLAQNIALNKPTSTSSTESTSLTGAQAVDGSATTRWASVQGVDPQWMYVDLGNTATITRVVLRWEAAFGRSYKIQTSPNASTWTDVFSTTTGDGGVDDITLTGSGRYVRMYGTGRGTSWGYSLWEMEVYGTFSTTTPTTTKLEAENAALTGMTTATAIAGYTGTGYIDGMDVAGDKVVFTVNMAAAGTYPLTVRFRNSCAPCEKFQNVKVNAAAAVYTSFNNTVNGWQDKAYGNVTLNAGANTIEISHSWGYTAFDYITIGGSGTTTPPPTGGAETRPTYNTGTGFFMKNAKLYDANGNEFIPLGANGPTFWQDETCGKGSFDDMARAGANAVRITSVTPTHNSWSWSSRLENQRAMVASAVANRLVPMLEMHDATCGSKYENDPQGAQYNLKPIVDYWVTPGMVQLCKDYERQLIVNIANEWGSTDFLFDWKEGYKTAISRMRAAGIKNMLVIDAGGNCGQFPNAILQYATEIINSDPERNVVFSVHMYAFWYSGTTNAATWRFQVESKLQEFKNNNIPVMVGEFGWEGTPDVSYDPRVVMSKTAELGFGWFFWSWYDQPDKPFYNVVKNYCTGYNGTDADLTAAGIGIVNGTNGMKARARRATIYSATAREGTPAAATGGLSLDVFPNPSSTGEVQLELKGFGKHAPARIAVLDVNGRALYGTQVVTDESGAGTVRLRTAPFGSGVRVISVRSGNRHLVKRLVVVE